jgi:hypothetical protein
MFGIPWKKLGKVWNFLGKAWIFLGKAWRSLVQFTAALGWPGQARP